MAPLVTWTWLPPSSFLLVVRPGHGVVDERGAGDHHLGGVLDDHRVVARGDARRADAGDGAEGERHRRRHRQVLHDRLPAPHLRDVGAAHHLDRLHRPAPAHPVDQPQVREPELEGEALGVVALGPDRGVGRAAPHGEVVAGDHHRAPVDLGHAADEVRRQERLQLAVVVVRAHAGDRAELVEGAAVDDPLDALADGELAELVLAGHLVGAAHLVGQLGAYAPAHRFPASSSSQRPYSRELRDLILLDVALDDVADHVRRLQRREMPNTGQLDVAGAGDRAGPGACRCPRASAGRPRRARPSWGRRCRQRAAAGATRRWRPSARRSPPWAWAVPAPGRRAPPGGRGGRWRSPGRTARPRSRPRTRRPAGPGRAGAGAGRSRPRAPGGAPAPADAFPRGRGPAPGRDGAGRAPGRSSRPSRGRPRRPARGRPPGAPRRRRRPSWRWTPAWARDREYPLPRLSTRTTRWRCSATGRGGTTATSAPTPTSRSAAAPSGRHRPRARTRWPAGGPCRPVPGCGGPTARARPGPAPCSWPR